MGIHAKYHLVLVFFLVIFCSSFYAEDNSSKVKQLQTLRQPWETIQDRFLEIKEQLMHAKILYGVPLGEYDATIRVPNNNKIVLLELENQEHVKAIFKPRGHAHQKVEVAAYAIAQYLGLKLVPPAVKAEFEGKSGVLSYFIDTENDVNFWKDKLGLEEIKNLVSPESLNNYYAFCFVFGMWDLKWVNILLVDTPPCARILSTDNESLISPVHIPQENCFSEHFYVCWKQDMQLVDISPYKDLYNFEPTVLQEAAIPEEYSYLQRFFTQDTSIESLEDPEEIKKTIMGRIKAFMWGKKEINHYIGQKCWWLQLYGGVPHIPPPQVTALSDYTKEQLKLLTVSKLRELFDDLNNTGAKPSFSDEHYEAMLKRRDMLLASLKIYA